MGMVFVSGAAFGKSQKQAAAGLYDVSEGMKRDYSVLELRDATGELWPMIWLAHPQGKGKVQITDRELDVREVTGEFTLYGAGADAQLIAGSRQEKRIGGALARSEAYTDKRGEVRTRRAGPDIRLKVQLKSATSGVATISFNGKTVKTEATVNIRPASPQGKGGLDIGGSCKTSAGALGLRGSDPVEVRFRVPGRLLKTGETPLPRLAVERLPAVTDPPERR